MRKGQEKLLRKAEKAGILPENLNLLKNESKPLKQLEDIYYLLKYTNINFPISEELAIALLSCKLYKHYKITPELEKIKNKSKINLYKKLTGVNHKYTPHPDKDFYFLSLLEDTSNTERINNFINFINFDDFPSTIEKLAYLFNKTPVQHPTTACLNPKYITQQYNPVSIMYQNFKKKWLYPESTVRDIFMHSDGFRLSVEIPSKTIEMKLHDKNISITFNQYQEIKSSYNTFPSFDNVNICSNHYIHPSKKRKTVTLISWNDNGIYEVLKSRDKVIPLTLKKANEYAALNPDLKKFILTYLKSQTNLMAKDLITLPRIPIAINKALEYNNIREMMSNYYKDGHKINWNRVNINTGYAVLKILNKVTNPNILLDMLYKNEIDEPEEKHWSLLKQETLFNVLLKRHPNLDPDIADDYIDMCLQTNQKINLQHTPRRIQREHDHIAYRITYANIPEIKIPENSKFKKLKLPKEFKWITTSKQLKKEGRIMHHCVASYAHTINNDGCAIYHIDKFDMPWTIEICKNKDKFYINQIQTKYNERVDKTKIEKYIQDILDKENNS